jgi:hypothetical protein
VSIAICIYILTYLENIYLSRIVIYFCLSHRDAIGRNSESVKKMKKEIWAILYHKISTDENPQHQNCPVGVDSWCTWQKVKASHKLAEYTHKPPLKEEIFTAVKPIYEDLSNDKLLTRCLGGFTQNNNESLNASMWAIAPKTFSSGKTVLDIATDIAVCNFNGWIKKFNGNYAGSETHQKLGQNCCNFCAEADARRVQAADRSLMAATKDARKALTDSRKEADETIELLEGQLYGPGIGLRMYRYKGKIEIFIVL